MRNWAQVFELSWRQRDAEIEAELRSQLSQRDGVFATKELANFLDAGQGFEAKIMSRLSVMAPYLSPFAAHDGEEFKKYGKTMKRWNWYGQKTR